MKPIRVLVVMTFVALLGADDTLPSPSHEACASQLQRALVVVKFSDSAEERFCITFAGDDLTEDPGGVTGLAALNATGLMVVTKTVSSESRVCKIAETGTDACDPKAGSWSYFHGTPTDSWEPSPEGPSTYRVHDGDVEGWVWSEGRNAASPPSPSNFEAACPQPKEEQSPQGAQYRLNQPDQSRGVPDKSAGRSTGTGELFPWLAIAVAGGTIVVAISTLVSLERSRRDK